MSIRDPKESIDPKAKICLCCGEKSEINSLHICKIYCESCMEWVDGRDCKSCEDCQTRYCGSCIFGKKCTSCVSYSEIYPHTESRRNGRKTETTTPKSKGSTGQKHAEKSRSLSSKEESFPTRKLVKNHSSCDQSLSRKCSRCGRSYHIEGCPATGQKCFKCGELDHFREMCPNLKNIASGQSNTKKVKSKKQSSRKVQGDSNKKEEKLHFNHVDFALLKGEVTSLKSRLDIVEKNQRESMLLQENSTPDSQTHFFTHDSPDSWICFD